MSDKLSAIGSPRQAEAANIGLEILNSREPIDRLVPSNRQELAIRWVHPKGNASTSRYFRFFSGFRSGIHSADVRHGYAGGRHTDSAWDARTCRRESMDRSRA